MDLGFANAGPVFQLDDQPAPTLARDAVELVVTESTDGLRALTLKLQAGGPDPKRPGDALRYLTRDPLDFGKGLKVLLGPDATQAIVFDGQISSLEAVLHDGNPPFVVVRAEDALMRLRMTHRMRTYIDVTDSDIAEEIGREHSLQVEKEADGPRYDVVQQWNQSDLAFLRDRARAIRAELWCVGTKLHFATRDKRRPNEIQLVHGNHLLAVRINADLAHQRSAVHVSGYDATSEETIDETADNAEVARETLRGTTGATLVADKLKTSASHRVRDGALTTAEARAFAKSEMLRRARTFVTAHGTTRGTPNMTVGSRLELIDVGPIFEGPDYYVTRVSHTFDVSNGFRTHFDAERTFINEIQR